ncbi:hypothetical protein ABD76_18865 [Paenibacillus dendritiformis]|uniref:hypothetical protein n=1 Tax=Paenibacillus dendritiformis TaxID=130049 RepID=UPI0018CCA727|nr:hypothetical protein [Paenibacillus dendritiformis]MBG9794454.1 hypothetical protein [Paenibacillus dendritiformis]
MSNVKTSIVIGGIVTACLVAGIMVSQASPPESIQQKIENGTAPISYHEPMSVGTPSEVQLKLERAWKNGVERLQRFGQTNSEAGMLSISGFQPFSAYTNSLDTWEIIDSGDIDIKFTNFFAFR